MKTEFVDLVEQQKIGIPLSRAFERMYERMPLQEVNFFAIVIAIQAQTGGNLPRRSPICPRCCATAIGCRPRSKPSAPRPRPPPRSSARCRLASWRSFICSTPAYMSLLLTEKLGNLMLIASAIWMLIGILVMRKMINFDY